MQGIHPQAPVFYDVAASEHSREPNRRKRNTIGFWLRLADSTTTWYVHATAEISAAKRTGDEVEQQYRYMLRSHLHYLGTRHTRTTKRYATPWPALLVPREMHNGKLLSCGHTSTR